MVRPPGAVAQAPVLNMKSAASAGGTSPGTGSTIARAAARLPANVVAPVMRRVEAVGGDEVDQRLGVLEVLTEVGPAGVRSELTVVGLRKDLAAELVQRWDAHIAGAGHVDRRQVEWQAEEVVAQRLDDELVELVADLVGRAHGDGARRLLGRQRTRGAAVEVLGWVQERVEQRGRVVGAVLVGAGDVVVEHRVTEAVDGGGELGGDPRVDVGVVDVEGTHHRLDLAGELLEHEVLVLHLGDEAGGLEQARTVPPVGRQARSRSFHSCSA